MKRAIGGALLALTATAAAACSSAQSGAGAPKLVKQSGRIVDYVPCNDKPPGVAGATVTIGGRSVTTDHDGKYEIDVEADKPFSMRVTKASDPPYVQLIEADNRVAADYDRGDTRFISTGLANVLSSALPKYDAARTLLTIELVKTGACTDLGGATVKVDAADGDTQVEYPAACITPVGENPFVTDGVFPSAVVYDLPPGPHSITVTSPKCTQIPFPYTDPTNGLTYDGTVTTEAGTGTSFIRVFMK